MVTFIAQLARSGRKDFDREYTCLMLADTTRPQTLECALGLKLDDGTYHAVDLSLMSQTAPDLELGIVFR